MRSVSFAVLAVAATLGLAACGEEVIDQDSLESSVLELAPANVKAESVSCPDDVSPDEGTEFECTVTTGNGELRITATVTSTDDEDVQFEITDAQPVSE
jgi:hypothetical protein